MWRLIADWWETFMKAPFCVLLVPTLLLLVSWLLGLKKYTRLHKKNLESWKKLPEFPIINHAKFMITYFYTIFMVVNTIPVLFIAFGTFFVKNISVYIIIVTYIFLIFNFLFLYILTLFSKVYHASIAATVIEDSLKKSQENAYDDYEIGKKQIAEKLWIQYLYRILLFCDVVGFPIAWYQDSAVETNLKEYYYTKVYTLVFHNIFYAMVPLACLFYLVMKYIKRGNRRKNPLKKQIMLQLYVISVLQLIFLTMSAVLTIVLDGFYPIFFCISLILPMIIQRTTIYVSRKNRTDSRIRPDAYSIELESV